MPLGLGLASSHAPAMFAEAEDWPRIFKRLIGNNPPAPAMEKETPEVLQDYVRRIRASFDVLRNQLIEYKPDALIIVGDDQNEVFAPNLMPSIAVYTGEEVAGTWNIGLLDQPLEENHVPLRCHSELARYLTRRLVDEGFDLSWMDELKAMSRPQGGLGHAFTRIARAMELDRLGIPIVPIFLNGYHDPMPTARRCHELGQAIAEALKDRPERVAIYGSGGLSHDPRGPRAGWLDEPLDHWVLKSIEEGRSEALTTLYTFQSDAMHGGTGEIRAWITVSGAFCGRAGKVVDYVPAYTAVTGLGFAYWEGEHVHQREPARL